MGDTTETVLEIDLSALEHNYNYIRTKLNPTTKLLAVVKAFAYGSDTVRIAQKLVELGADYFAVAYTKEGVLLRDAGIKTPILVLHPQKGNFDELIQRCLEPSIYSFRVLKEFLATAEKHGQTNYPVHLKFNTGLNRLGFSANNVDNILKHLEGRNEIKILSIFSHLAASEDKAEIDFTRTQIDSFRKICREVDKKFGFAPFKHLLNTSGVINYPEAQHDMVRTGIALYGFGNDQKIDAELKPVATLKTVISQIHQIAPNESVGYNRAFTSSEFKTTATLPLGHADGIGRQYGNGKAYVTIKGQKAPIIGNVCMDMIMVDITGIECQEGDQVIVFGQSHTADSFAAGANTISYELLTGISQRVKRLFLGL